MKIQAIDVRHGDHVFLAGEWLTVTASAIVKSHFGPTSKYTHVKLWFTDDTAFTTLRDAEVEVER